ncbi:Mobile element protein [Moraxella catarrhalis]|nr:Mobile element protein [Moraxella catarrhalis]
MNETFNNCPKCHCTHFVKAGLGNGKQRYKCKGCNHYFSVKQRSNQKSNDIKKQAIDMYLEGLGFRSIGRVLNISYGTVYQWVKQLGKQHQIRQDTNQTIDIVELDEIHSYTKHKKTIAGLGLPLTETVNKS